MQMAALPARQRAAALSRQVRAPSPAAPAHGSLCRPSRASRTPQCPTWHLSTLGKPRNGTQGSPTELSLRRCFRSREGSHRQSAARVCGVPPGFSES